MLTPYQFANNSPIEAIDLDGLEALQVTYGEGGVSFYAPSEYFSSYRHVALPIKQDPPRPEIKPYNANWAGQLYNNVANNLSVPPFFRGAFILGYTAADEAYILGTKTLSDLKLMEGGARHLNRDGVTSDELILAGVGVYGAIIGANFEAGFSKFKNARWAQVDFRNTFSRDGKKILDVDNIDEAVRRLKSGEMSITDIEINVIERDGQAFILNTRSSATLQKAGIDRKYWNWVDKTGDEFFEKLLDDQLLRNNTTEGFTGIRNTDTDEVFLQSGEILNPKK